MKNKITVITSIRNREAWRIKTMVESIRNTGATPSFIIVDYGSTEEYATEYEKLCKELKIKYFHLYSEGLPWNKSRALNFGAKKAATPFIVTSDVDMIHEKDAFTWCLENYTKNSIYQISTFWLDKTGNKETAKSAGIGSPGVFSFTTRDAFAEIGGYDERYLYWGQEDLDFPMRLKKIGYKQIWLPEEYKIYHQWHPVSGNGHLRPESASAKSISYILQNSFNPILNQDWGKNLTKEDRPILDLIKTGSYSEISLDNYQFGNTKQLFKVYDFLNEKKIIKLNLNSRVINRPLDKFKSFAKKIFHPICALYGLKVEDAINHNFDFFYETLFTLYPNVVNDYYIAQDLSYVYLLKD